MKQRIITLFAGGLLALALFGVAEAGSLEEGLAGIQNGDYTAALQILRPLADQGNPSRRVASARFMRMAKACHKTTRRLSPGTARPLTTDSLARSTARVFSPAVNPSAAAPSGVGVSGTKRSPPPRPQGPKPLGEA